MFILWTSYGGLTSPPLFHHGKTERNYVDLGYTALRFPLFIIERSRGLQPHPLCFMMVWLNAIERDSGDW